MFDTKDGLGKFSPKKYNETIELLEKGETIKILDYNMGTGKKFKNGSKKVVYWDANKQEPRRVI